MKPPLIVVDEDKKEQSTINTLFEDLYNRVLPSDITNQLQTGALTNTHIDSVTTWSELNYVYFIAHCVAVKNAVLYDWAIRKKGTTVWTEFFCSSNTAKLINLYPETEYEIRVKAYGMLLISSPWSAIVISMSATLTPSKVTGVVVTDEALYVDPSTGVTLASVRIEWNNNADSELVDSYEVLWY